VAAATAVAVDSARGTAFFLGFAHRTGFEQRYPPTGGVAKPFEPDEGMMGTTAL